MMMFDLVGILARSKAMSRLSRQGPCSVHWWATLGDPTLMPILTKKNLNACDAEIIERNLEALKLGLEVTCS